MTTQPTSTEPKFTPGQKVIHTNGDHLTVLPFQSVFVDDGKGSRFFVEASEISPPLPEPRLIFFTPTGKPPKLGEWYSNTESLVLRAGAIDADYVKDQGLTRRELTLDELRAEFGTPSPAPLPDGTNQVRVVAFTEEALNFLTMGQAYNVTLYPEGHTYFEAFTPDRKMPRHEFLWPPSPAPPPEMDEDELWRKYGIEIGRNWQGIYIWYETERCHWCRGVDSWSCVHAPTLFASKAQAKAKALQLIRDGVIKEVGK